MGLWAGHADFNGNRPGMSDYGSCLETPLGFLFGQYIVIPTKKTGHSQKELHRSLQLECYSLSVPGRIAAGGSPGKWLNLRRAQLTTRMLAGNSQDIADSCNWFGNLDVTFNTNPRYEVV